MSEQQFYDSYYAHLDEAAHKWRDFSGAIKARNIINIASSVPNVRDILDIGCGTGAVLANLERLNYGEHYHAIDIAQPAVEATQRRHDISRLEEARTFDGRQIPYPDKRFDLAIMSHVVEHIAEPCDLIREAARVARYVAIEVPLEDNLHIHLKVDLFKSRYREELGHIPWFNQGSFRRLLQNDCGLIVENLQMAYLPDEVYYYRKSSSQKQLVALQLGVRHTLRRLSPALYGRILADHCIALVRSAL